MFDFRLKVFHTVAKRLNFTKAAAELSITQPAVTKHIKEIERQLNAKLFDRNGTKIKLTAAGKVLLKYTDQIFEIYRELEFEISSLNHKQQGSLRIGASTTIAQYVLPPLLADFHAKFKDIKVSLFNSNTESIEHLLEQKKIDLGITEGQSKNKLFHYTRFIKDEIVLAAREGHPMSKKPAIKLDELKKLPVILRESGSGTLETIAFALKAVGIKLSDLNTEMQLGNSESIKSYLLHSDCVAFLSIYSILNELNNRTMTVIDIKNLSIERFFYFIMPQGSQSPIASLFMKFSKSYNFK